MDTPNKAIYLGMRTFSAKNGDSLVDVFMLDIKQGFIRAMMDMKKFDVLGLHEPMKVVEVGTEMVGDGYNKRSQIVSAKETGETYEIKIK